MKKLDISKSIVKNKWLTILITAIVLIILGRTVNSIALTKSATVIGVGVDFDAVNGFTITTQSVIVSGASNAGASTSLSYVLFTEKGSTIIQAADKIKQKTGLTLSLSHCNVVILSKSALTLDHTQLIAPLVKNLSLPEQAVMVSSEISPQELLSKKMSTTVNVPYYLQSALLENIGSDGIVKLSIKDFLAKTKSRSGSLIMPHIEVLTLDDQPLNPSGETTDFVKLKTSKALIFNQNSSQVMGEELSKIAALYNSNTVTGALNIKLDTGECIEFGILKKEQKRKVNDRNVKTDITLFVSFVEAQHASSSDIILPTAQLITRAAAELGKQLTANLIKCFEFSQRFGIDFFELENYVYQHYGRTLEEDCFKTITFTPTVTLKIKESA